MMSRRQRIFYALFLSAITLFAFVALLNGLTARELTLHAFGQEVVFLEPAGFSVLSLLVFVFGFLRFSLARLSRTRSVIAASARALAIAFVAAALARPITRTETSHVHAVIAIDVSESMSAASLERARKFALNARAAQGEHDLDVLTFANSVRRQTTDALEAGPLKHSAQRDRTDIEGALASALSFLSPNAVRKVVLLSDGRATHGDFSRAAEQVRAQGAILDFLDLGKTTERDVAITSIGLPNDAKAGEPFRVNVKLRATDASKVRVRLRQNDVMNSPEGLRELELSPGITDLQFRTIAYAPGIVRYDAAIEVEAGDHFSQNDSFAASTLVRGKPQVLYVEGELNQSRPFAELLRASGFDVDVRSASGMPTSLPELSSFDFLVLSNVPAEALSLNGVNALESFVQRGGGFLMAGGEQGFGLGGYRGTKMESLLPVRLDTERRRDQPTLALALVIDKSGSMSGQKIELAKEAARATADLLGPDDYLGVIGFDAQPNRVVRLQTAENRLALSKGIGRMLAGGGTAIFPALDAAYQDLAAIRARLKHVILLTDGQTQEEGLPVLVQNMQVDGITVSTIGLGDDVNRSLLEELARLGGGRSYLTSDPNSIPRLFMKETHAVSRSAAVEDYVAAHVTSPADFLRGIAIEGAPFLRGYVATRARPLPAQVVLSSDLGEPLLARVHLGLGWSLAWTSDLTPRWSSEWLRWRQASTFWAQLVREHMRQEEDDVLPIRTEREGDVLIASIDALDADERFVHDLQGTLELERSERGSETERASLREVAPGRYEARIKLSALGSYTLRASLVGEDGTRLSARGNFSHPFPAEYEGVGVAREALLAAASVSGGAELGRAEQIFDAGPRRVRAQHERWSLFVWLSVAAFLADLLARRARWPRSNAVTAPSVK
jgi:uncharacterized membrane protein